MNIERMQPADFDAVYRLLTQSFPATERRGAAGQRALFSDSAYRVDILRAPDGGVQALIASWDFDDFVFLEHFAVDPACRSGGIGFYERHGFTVNADYAYFQPALAPGGDPLPMHLLTTGGARTSAELRAMETLVHTRVYGQAPAAEQ